MFLPWNQFEWKQAMGRIFPHCFQKLIVTRQREKALTETQSFWLSRGPHFAGFLSDIINEIYWYTWP